MMIECTKEDLLAQIEYLQSRIEALEQFKTAYEEWHDKTEWVHKTATAKELGMHRADVLRERIEVLEKDAARLMYATKDYDGFVHVKKDKWDFALECSSENSREPTCEDELNGVRRLIDTAMQSEKGGKL